MQNISECTSQPGGNDAGNAATMETHDVNVQDLKYRENREESSTESDDESSVLSLSSTSTVSSSSISSSSSGVEIEKKVRPQHLTKVANRTRGELTYDDLPVIEDLTITVPESEIRAIGRISAIVDKLVVVHSFKNSPALDSDSILFLQDGKPLGKIFEVLGPVVEPFYAVRFNTTDEIKEKSVKVDEIIYYSPDNEEVTLYIFVDNLKSLKGSDASWHHNNEPPEQFLDYSDDEQERRANQKRRAKNRRRDFDDESVVDIPTKSSNVSDDANNFVDKTCHSSNYANNTPTVTQENASCRPYLNKQVSVTQVRTGAHAATQPVFAPQRQVNLSFSRPPYPTLLPSSSVSFNSFAKAPVHSSIFIPCVPSLPPRSAPTVPRFTQQNPSPANTVHVQPFQIRPLIPLPIILSSRMPVPRPVRPDAQLIPPQGPRYTATNQQECLRIPVSQFPTPSTIATQHKPQSSLITQEAFVTGQRFISQNKAIVRVPLLQNVVSSVSDMQKSPLTITVPNHSDSHAGQSINYANQQYSGPVVQPTTMSLNAPRAQNFQIPNQANSSFCPIPSVFRPEVRPLYSAASHIRTTCSSSISRPPTMLFRQGSNPQPNVQVLKPASQATFPHTQLSSNICTVPHSAIQPTHVIVSAMPLPPPPQLSTLNIQPPRLAPTAVLPLFRGVQRQELHRAQMPFYDPRIPPPPILK